MKLRERILPSGAVSFFLDYRVDGRRVREHIPDITLRGDAELYLARRKTEVAKGVVGLPRREGLTVEDALDALFRDKEATCSPGHVKTLKARVAQIKEAFGAGTPIKMVSLDAVNTWRRGLLSDGEQPPTVNKKAEMLRAAVVKARRAELISESPLEGLQRTADSRREVWRWLGETEIETLLDALGQGVEVEIKRRKKGNYKTRVGRNVRLYRLTVFLLNSGARAGEALSLTWADVDFGRGLVALHTGKHGGAGQKKRARFVPMNETLRSLLEEMRGEAKDDPLSATVFEYPNNYVRDFEAAARRAGLGHVRPHDCRHSFASHLAINGTPLHAIRELLGHANMTMTLRYAHLSPAVTAQAVQGLNFGPSRRAAARVVSVGKPEDNTA